MTIKQLRFRPERCTRCATCGYGCSMGTLRAATPVGMPPGCNLCFGDPACVVACPVGAFEYVDVDQAAYWIGPPATNPLVSAV
jgi:carbon-monoxide dehydrogenase iron sulfur subunit